MRGLLLTVLPVVMSLLMGGLIIFLGGRHPPARLVGGVRRFAGLVEKRSEALPLFERIRIYLDRNGASFHYGKNISPVKLILISLLLFATGWMTGLRLGTAVSILASVTLCILPWIMLSILNKSDNEKMLPDLQVIYHGLSMQIRAGVHVSDALSEMYSGVRFKRLREALMSLGSDIILKSDIFSALENFQQKFDNRYIDSLCITLLQSMESGQAAELLSDIGDQMKDMEKSVLEKKKGRLDRSLTFYQLGMLASILAVALYACVSYMLSAAVGMGI